MQNTNENNNVFELAGNGFILVIRVPTSQPNYAITGAFNGKDFTLKYDQQEDKPRQIISYGEGFEAMQVESSAVNESEELIPYVQKEFDLANPKTIFESVFYLNIILFKVKSILSSVPDKNFVISFMQDLSDQIPLEMGQVKSSIDLIKCSCCESKVNRIVEIVVHSYVPAYHTYCKYIVGEGCAKKLKPIIDIYKVLRACPMKRNENNIVELKKELKKKFIALEAEFRNFQLSQIK